ncbi:hypothetical protein TRICI_001436 [Trichomonascus ciferrii]|uniref:Uncharacterized protein n=1 Tax=Trichomonascus ciferrii TaxID=44093 RepID=A0A642V9E9_9ASCO|nr:hypothetical protein TRICI_001436 [Trichomonascus ciferrii]
MPVDFYLGCSVNALQLDDDGGDEGEFDNSRYDRYCFVDPDHDDLVLHKSIVRPPTPPVTSPIQVLSAMDDEDDESRLKNASSLYSMDSCSTKSDLIEINLDPPSPLLLGQSSSSSDLSLSTNNSAGSCEDYYRMANIIPDPWIQDQFHDTRPILADPERPFIPASPIFESVDELLKTNYPDLLNDPQLYEFHKRRLLTNRHKLTTLRKTIYSQYDRRLSMSSYKPNNPRSKLKLN